MKKAFMSIGVFLLLCWLSMNAYTHWYDQSVFVESEDYRIVSASSNLSEGKRLRPAGSLLREGEVDEAVLVYHVAVGQDVVFNPGLADLRFVGEERSYADEHGLLEQEATTFSQGECAATGDALYRVEVRLRILTPDEEIVAELPRDIRSVAFSFSINWEE